jgi:uncharacterized membrane protein YdjX (TVP38/TMEM64 family)
MILFLRQLFQQNFSSLLLMALSLIIPLLGSSALAGLFYYHYQSFLTLNWWQALLYFAVTAITMALALTPTTFIALVTGFFFGWPGFIGMVISYMGALMIARALTTLLDHGTLWNFLHHFPKVGAVLDELQRQQFGMIVLSRLSPVLPFALMNFVLSMLQVSKRNYLVGSLLGMLPRTAFFYWIGTQGQAVFEMIKDPAANKLNQIVILTLFVLSLFGLMFLITRAVRKALRQPENAV